MIGLTDPSDNIDFVMRQLAIKLRAKASGIFFDPFTPDSAKSTIDKFFKITNLLKLKNITAPQ